MTRGGGSVPQPSSKGAKRRLPLVDLARGAALVAMALYHFGWDLGFLGFVEIDPQYGWEWIVARTLIASAFLAVVGVGLVLAAEGGLDRRAYVLRLLRIAAGAALVTLVTWFVVPNAFVFFGILHSIAVASVLGLLFLRLPIPLVIAAAVACIVLPWVARDPVFDRPELLWLGLAETPPISNDYVPLLPWFGPVLLGIAASRLWLGAGALGGEVDGGAAGRKLRWAGRHSLAFYLVHQPLLIGLLLLVGMALGRDPEAMLAGRAPIDREEFVVNCQASCAGTGTEAPVCTAYCSCLFDRFSAEGFWPTTAPSDEEMGRIGAIVAACSPAE